MTTRPTSLPSPSAMHCPAPISLETLAVAEEVLLQMLRDWRARLEAPAPEAAAVEYESWLRGARH